MTPEEECGAMFEKGAYGRAQTLSNSTARLKQCDSITVSARAALPGARDINVIHIDANYCVTSQYARLKDERAESPIGPGLIACSECPGGNSVGFERLFVVVAEARQHKEPLNLTGVFANCDSRTNARSSGTLSRTRGGRQPVGDMAPASALFAKSEQDTIWVDGFSWKIIPRAMAISE